MEEREKRVYEALEGLGIPYVRRKHPPVATVAEAVEYWKGLPGALCKNLFVRNKPGKRHYLIVAEHLKPLDLLAISHTLGDSRLSFASDERMKRCIGLHPGEVSPFGLLYDEKHEVIVVLDKELTQAESVNFHPNVNTATLTISTADLLKFLKSLGNRVVISRL
jgi:Ala-tRNA(Pro) deacylase